MSEMSTTPPDRLHVRISTAAGRRGPIRQAMRMEELVTAALRIECVEPLCGQTQTHTLDLKMQPA